MAARYVCPECGNEVAAERVERRVPGSKTHVYVVPNVECSCGGEMKHETYERPAREVAG
jgi:hypothetical protein